MYSLLPLIYLSNLILNAVVNFVFALVGLVAKVLYAAHELDNY